MNKSFAVLFLGLTACNYDAGECYARNEGGEGIGGSVITPGGAGGFGDVPPEPQGGPSPADPCSATAECTVTWKAGSEHCKEKGTTGTCTSLYQGEHTSLDKAKERCEAAHGATLDSGVASCGPCHWVTSADSKCTDKCHSEHDQGHQECNKVKDKEAQAKCHQAVNEKWATCLNKCNKK